MWVKKTFRSGCVKGKCACKDPMWVRVRTVESNGTIVGQLHNTPDCYPLKWGARVEVKPEEVTDVTMGEGETDTKLFVPRGQLPRAPRPYAPPPKPQINWANMAAAVLAGVTLATLVSSYARNA